METPLNQRIVTLKLRRIDLCKLMIACTAVSDSVKQSGETGEHWDKLHEAIKQAIDEFDAKHGY